MTKCDSHLHCLTLQLSSPAWSAHGFTYSPLQGGRNFLKIVFTATGTPIFQLLLQFTEKCFSVGKSGTGEKRSHSSSEDGGDKFTLLFTLVVLGCYRKELKNQSIKSLLKVAEIDFYPFNSQMY